MSNQGMSVLFLVRLSTFLGFVTIETNWDSCLPFRIVASMDTSHFKIQHENLGSRYVIEVIYNVCSSVRPSGSDDISESLLHLKWERNHVRGLWSPSSEPRIGAHFVHPGLEAKYLSTVVRVELVAFVICIHIIQPHRVKEYLWPGIRNFHGHTSLYDGMHGYHLVRIPTEGRVAP